MFRDLGQRSSGSVFDQTMLKILVLPSVPHHCGLSDNDPRTLTSAQPEHTDGWNTMRRKG